MDKNVKADLSGLEDLLRALKGEYFLRVGIIGSKATGSHDSESGKTNAEIGTFHEFGTTKMPRRSFLEDSLKYKLNPTTKEFKQLKKGIFKFVFLKKSPKDFLQDLGAKCLEIIEEGFATSGFGMWKQLSASYYNQKMSKAPKRLTPKSMEWFNYHQILTDTGKLRKSIAFKVMKKS